ncbi:MAG: hypothetical protein K5930_07560 [Treponemataceae bacterium]|nr:hypothetical protein [Treponemataceae bacterium]
MKRQNNGNFSFLADDRVHLEESTGNITREPWLMLLARRNRPLTDTLCWGITNNGSDFARIGTQEGDLINGFVHEDPYKTRLLGSYIYFKDEDGTIFTNKWYPLLNKEQKLETDFQFGSVKSTTSFDNIKVVTEAFIPEEYDSLIQLVTVTNESDKEKKLDVYSVSPVNLGDARALQFSGFNSMMMAGGFYDKDLDALVWRNDYGIPFDSDEDTIKGLFGKVLIHTISEKSLSYSMKYEDFVGHYTNTMANPAGLKLDKLPCRNAEDMTSALSVLHFKLTLKAKESKQFVVSESAVSTEKYYKNKAVIKELCSKLKEPEKIEVLLEKVKASWCKEFDLLKLQVPGEELFSHSFRWLQYQCAMVMALNRMKSRFHSGFEYGFGFRDILQDILALLPYDTDRVRESLLYIAKQMFSKGSAYHNFYVSAPGTTDFNACDDPIWFIFAVCEYIKESGDFAFLDALVKYADEKEGMTAKEGSIFEHCKVALSYVWDNSENGLPIMHDADWNDDLSGYPDHLSVMAAEMLYKAYTDFAELCESFEDMEKKNIAKHCLVKASLIKETVDKNCIDSKGAYIRLLGPGCDKKKAVGSSDTDKLLFLETTAWAGYSGIANEKQFMTSASIVKDKLAAKGGLCLCTPSRTLAEGKLPEDWTAYKRNAPGKKENGSFFRHVESWYIASLCRYGKGKEAWKLFYETLPAVCSQEDPYGYAAERFVYPEYVAGPASVEYMRAGHTWLTGTAPTRLRVVCENIFGLRASYEGLIVDPCVPSDWKKFSASRKFRNTIFYFNYENISGLEKGVKALFVDGKECKANIIPLSFCDGKKHEVKVVMG